MKQKRRRPPREPDESFDERFNRITEAALDMCKNNGDLNGHTIAYDQADDVHVLTNTIDHHEHTEIFAQVCRRFFRLKKIREYYFICSAWTVMIEDHRKMAQTRAQVAAGKRELHLHPERREVVVAIGVRGDRKRMKSFLIEREDPNNEESAVTGFQLVLDCDGSAESGGFDGRFANLLTPLEGH